MVKDINCPLCNNKGEKVKVNTVKHLVFENKVNEIDDDNYFICKDEKCDVVYYSDKKVFYKKDIKVPVWFKDDANPKYICYCSKTTEDEIIDAVVNKNARSIKDIVKITGAMKSCNCEINNPLGKCCSPAINETIKKAISKHGL